MKEVAGLFRKGLAGRLRAAGDTAIDLLFQALPPTLMVDPSGVVIRANAAAMALLPDALPGRAAISLLPVTQRQDVADALKAVFRSEAPQPRGPVRVTPVREADGRVAAALLHFPPEGLTGVSPGQLEAGQRLQALGQLVGGIAHDFNNLLTAIAASAAAAAEVPADIAAEAARIRDATQRGADLARRLLAFGRQQTLQPCAIEANAAVAAAADLLHRLMGEPIDVTLSLEQPGRVIHVDPTQLDQVLVNLAVNARDAMPAGGRLTLATGHATLIRPLPAIPEPVPPGRWVTISVRDTGPGIPAAVLPHIFEPFFTTRTPQAGQTGGTGLGLSTVHGIVHQSAGHLTVETQQGAGTTMTVYLPRWDGPVTPRAPLPARPAEPANGEGRTVLLVEDEDMIRTLAARTLTRRGWNVLQAACGEDALELLDPVPPALSAIVSDVIMPGMDGPALVRAVRARVGDPALPAILVSGYAAEAQRNALAELGAVFIAKPYDMPDLADRLAALVVATAR